MSGKGLSKWLWSTWIQSCFYLVSFSFFFVFLLFLYIIDEQRVIRAFKDLFIFFNTTHINIQHIPLLLTQPMQRWNHQFKGCHARKCVWYRCNHTLIPAIIQIFIYKLLEGIDISMQTHTYMSLLGLSFL